MDVGYSSTDGGIVDGRVLHQVVLEIHHRLGSPEKQQAMAVMELSDFIRGQQLPVIISGDCMDTIKFRSSSGRPFPMD